MSQYSARTDNSSAPYDILNGLQVITLQVYRWKGIKVDTKAKRETYREKRERERERERDFVTYHILISHYHDFPIT